MKVICTSPPADNSQDRSPPRLRRGNVRPSCGSSRRLGMPSGEATACSVDPPLVPRTEDLRGAGRIHPGRATALGQSPDGGVPPPVTTSSPQLDLRLRHARIPPSDPSCGWPRPPVSSGAVGPDPGRLSEPSPIGPSGEPMAILPAGRRIRDGPAPVRSETGAVGGYGTGGTAPTAPQPVPGAPRRAPGDMRQLRRVRFRARRAGHRGRRQRQRRDRRNVGYIDSAIIRSRIRVRYDAAYDLTPARQGRVLLCQVRLLRQPEQLRPGRGHRDVRPQGRSARGYDPQARGPQHSRSCRPTPSGQFPGRPSINYQEQSTYLEYAPSGTSRRSSRSPSGSSTRRSVRNTTASPTSMSAPSTPSWPNPNGTTRSSSAPTPRPAHTRASDGPCPLEPALLVFQRLSERLYFSGEFRDWIPVGGSTSPGTSSATASG